MNKKTKHIKDLVVLFFSVLSIYTFFFAIQEYKSGHYGFSGLVSETHAATYYDFHGQAWSDTIGWLSFNCAEGGPTNNNICATSNYKVSTDAIGNISGYAWSDSVGWISFNATSGCPNSPCAAVLNAGNVTGWARVLSPILATPPASGSQDPNPGRGGWDGWIELSGTNSNVTRSGNDLAGAAWGDLNLGWVSFNCSNGGSGNINICGTSNYKVYLTSTTIPDPTLSWNPPSHYFVGNSPVFSWTATNVNTCTASGSWSGAKAISGTETLGAYGSTGTYNYTLKCDDTVYNTTTGNITRQIDVTDGICNGAETATSTPYDCTSIVNKFEANPKVVKPGKSSKLSWNITAGQTCKVYTPTNVILSNITDGNQTGFVNVSNVTVKTTYRLSCLGGVDRYTTVSPYLLYEY